MLFLSSETLWMQVNCRWDGELVISRWEIQYFSRYSTEELEKSDQKNTLILILWYIIVLIFEPFGLREIWLELGSLRNLMEFYSKHIMAHFMPFLIMLLPVLIKSASLPITSCSNTQWYWSGKSPTSFLSSSVGNQKMVLLQGKYLQTLLQRMGNRNDKIEQCFI